VVDPGDPAALASAIRSIVDRSPEEKRAARERATRAAGDRWNWETESRKLLALYDDLIGSA
jgi:glycosyltransferase involved in cell wall biosynthesis